MKLSNIVLHAYGVTAAQAVSCEKNKPHFGAYFMLRFTPPIMFIFFGVLNYTHKKVWYKS